MLSIAHAHQARRNYWVQMIDMDEFETRLIRAKFAGEITENQWIASLDLLIQMNEQAFNELDQATKSNYRALGAMDAGLWAVGGVLTKYISRGLSLLGQKISSTGLLKNTSSTLGNILSKMQDRVKAQAQRFRGLRQPTLHILAINSVKLSFPKAMRGLMTKQLLVQHTKNALVTTGNAFKSAAGQWRYLSLMSSLQFSTEVIVNSSDVYDRDPRQFAQNIAEHPQILRNVGFMTTNAFLMTAASSAIKPKGISMLVCGFIALSNSLFTNLVIFPSDNTQRIVVDTAWESVIGNAQIQIDLASLAYFERMAIKHNNPKIKILGYAVVLVDQTAGFAGYSELTSRMNQNNQEMRLMLTPVLAEE
jgi:hypothetical protein